ncbi:MAG: 3-hydroxyacyl-ACP dehydratase FabZ [Syntrophorhabdales bacterium]|jgi:3-hydroxyacyl-[acyl-carrier-protein] dehydratase
MIAMDFEEIKRSLPHRFPFLMIDRIHFLDPGKRVVASKNISGNDIVFLGHFPGKSIYPGVMITEAIAQAAGIVLKERGGKAAEMMLAHSDIRFLRPVIPGDRLTIEVRTEKVARAGAVVAARVKVLDKLVAKGRMVLKTA